MHPKAVFFEKFGEHIGLDRVVFNDDESTYDVHYQTVPGKTCVFNANEANLSVGRLTLVRTPLVAFSQKSYIYVLMKKTWSAEIARRLRLLTVFLLLAPCVGVGAGRPNYPPSRAESIRETLFGVEVKDPYRWLEAEGSPEVAAWSKEQNALARKMLDGFDGRDELKAELEPMFRLERRSGVQVKGTRIFYQRTPPDKEQPLLCWRETTAAQETVAIDFNATTSSGAAVLGAWYPSPNGKWILYATHPHNGTLGTLHLWNVDAKLENTAESIPWADYADLSWGADSAGFYYTRLPVGSRIPVSDYPGFSVVSYHKLGNPPAGDAEVFPASGSPGIYLKPEASADGRWIFISVIDGYASSKIFYRENQPGVKFRPLFESEN
jgi:prolyl oligopeptidase